MSHHWLLLSRSESVCMSSIRACSRDPPIAVQYSRLSALYAHTDNYNVCIYTNIYESQKHKPVNAIRSPGVPLLVRRNRGAEAAHSRVGKAERSGQNVTNVGEAEKHQRDTHEGVQNRCHFSFIRLRRDVSIACWEDAQSSVRRICRSCLG